MMIAGTEYTSNPKFVFIFISLDKEFITIYEAIAYPLNQKSLPCLPFPENAIEHWKIETLVQVNYC